MNRRDFLRRSVVGVAGALAGAAAVTREKSPEQAMTAKKPVTTNTWTFTGTAGSSAFSNVIVYHAVGDGTEMKVVRPS